MFFLFIKSVLFLIITKECDPFKVFNSHLEDETTTGCNQHCHQHRGPSHLEGAGGVGGVGGVGDNDDGGDDSVDDNDDHDDDDCDALPSAQGSIPPGDKDGVDGGVGDNVDDGDDEAKSEIQPF